MRRIESPVHTGKSVVTLYVMLNIVIMKEGLVSGASWYTLLFATLPLLILSVKRFKPRTSRSLQ
ncbi:MAG: hypothetical protein ABWZ25_18295 [Chitinophagaceae bacterium]